MEISEVLVDEIASPHTEERRLDSIPKSFYVLTPLLQMKKLGPGGTNTHTKPHNRRGGEAGFKHRFALHHSLLYSFHQNASQKQTVIHMTGRKQRAQYT